VIGLLYSFALSCCILGWILFPRKGGLHGQRRLLVLLRIMGCIRAYIHLVSSQLLSLMHSNIIVYSLV
jgi:hypothetical protein